jgi:hypothetical protein
MKVLVTVLALWVGAAAFPAMAQRAGRTPARARVAPIKAAEKPARRRASPRRVIRLKGDVIEGKAQKPEALYILHRSGMSFEGLDPNTKLVPKIFKALKKAPF